MIGSILQPSQKQIQGPTSYLRGVRLKVLSKTDKHNHKCNVWGYLCSDYNGEQEVLTEDLLNMNVICIQL